MAELAARRRMAQRATLAALCRDPADSIHFLQRRRIAARSGAQREAPGAAIRGVSAASARNLSCVPARLLQTNERAGVDSVAVCLSRGVFDSAEACCGWSSQADRLGNGSDIV